jgi:hypothetical protein
MNRKAQSIGWGWMLVALLLFPLGCSDSSSDNDSGDDDTGAAIDIGVEYQGTGHAVDLTTLESETVNHVAAVKLSLVVEAALPDADLASLTVDFVAYDGFSPAQSPNCTDLIPLDGSLLDQGWIELATTNLDWASSLHFPGCMSLKGVTQILVYDKTSD